IINIQGDEPFINPSQIEIVKSCFAEEGTQIATLVKQFSKDEGFEALMNPNSPKVVLGRDNEALYFSRSVIPYIRGAAQEEWLSRGIFYKHIGMYAYRADILKQITKLPQTQLEISESLEQLRWLQNGYKIRAGITTQDTIGIDTPEDMAKALARFAQ
ncbi:MAG: 3-deoxy-manno-octulosonate cytidylyltransferase, partial [Bacteroidales bacterium]